MLRKLLDLNKSVYSSSLRSYVTRYFNKQEGISYPGFTYYPRHPEEKDPPYNPTKLFMVKRIKSLRFIPRWERRIMSDFKLENNDIAIVKNIPENNARLWRVKHLIEITPIQFPNGEPTPSDLNKATQLRENGDFEITQQISPERLEATEKFLNNPDKLDGQTLRRDSRKKWMSGW